MADLFALTDLAAWLQVDVADLDELLAEQVRGKVTGLVGAEVRIPDPPSAALTSVAASIAARLYDNPLAYKAETFAGYSGTYGDASLTADERAAVRGAVVGASGGRRAGSSKLIYTSGWV